MNWINSTLVTVALTLVVGVTVVHAEKEEEIPLTEVPKKVLTAAQEAVPGIKLTEAEVEKSRKGLIYELEGTLDRKDYEIEVSADGKVLEIEHEDDDDDQEDDDDEDEGETDYREED